jgi:uncharacterized membrane protein YraQ (UPF0718 family)
LLDAAGSSPTLQGAWEFSVTYFDAVWRALVVALLVAAALDALVPRRWLLGVLSRDSRLGQALVGGAVSTPSMMCTCCTAPVAVGLRRRGAPLAASIAYWTGNPLLNPAVLVFLALVLPWQYAAVRLVVGAAVVVAGSALVARLVGQRDGAAVVPVAEPDDPVRVRDLPGRFLRSLARLALVLVPEYAVVVVALGLVTAATSGLDGWAALGPVGLLVAALVAVVLVVPTGGEIPVVLAALAAGAGPALGGVLLVALPALSLPSAVMVGRALGWRATAATAGVVVVAALTAGALVGGLS